MNKEQFKPCLVRDKIFLKELYESNSQAKSKRILQFADDAQIHFDALEKRHLAHIKKSFEKKEALKNLLNRDRKEKLKTLFKLCQGFPHLLAPLFNE